MGTGLAILAVAAVVSVGWVWTGNSAHTPELPPSGAVAARFPAEWNTQRPKSAAALALLRAQEERATARVTAQAPALEWLSPFLQFDNAQWDLAAVASLEAPVTGSIDPFAETRHETIMLPRPSGRTARMFTDAQIASVKARLNLTSAQDKIWPAVEEGLRAIAWRRERLDAKTATLDPKSLDRLKSAMIPFLKILRTDQKDELRMIAHVMGIKKLAAQF